MWKDWFRDGKNVQNCTFLEFLYLKNMIKCHILIDLLKLYFVSRNSILNKHICRATIQNYKKKIFQNFRAYSWFLRFFSEKWHGFSSKSWTITCSTKIWLEKDFSKIPKENGWNHYKMLKEIDFWPSAGRESLWTTGEKVGFSKAHCDV
jgi:hypothetical protein